MAEERHERFERVVQQPVAGHSAVRGPVEHVEHVERERSVFGATAPSATNLNVRQAAGPAAANNFPDYAPLAVAKVTQLLWFICAVLELLLMARVLLLFAGANRAAPFARIIYAATQPFAAPFLGLFPGPAPVPPGGAVFEITTTLAMVVYFLLFLLFSQLLRLLVSRPRATA